MGEVQLITSIMRCKVIDKGEFYVHLRGEDDLHKVKSIVELEDEMEGFVDLQHLEYSIMVLELEDVLLCFDED